MINYWLCWSDNVDKEYNRNMIWFKVKNKVTNTNDHNSDVGDRRHRRQNTCRAIYLLLFSSNSWLKLRLSEQQTCKMGESMSSHSLSVSHSLSHTHTHTFVHSLSQTQTLSHIDTKKTFDLLCTTSVTYKIRTIYF